MINLFISYFDHHNEERAKEINYCVGENILNDLIDRVIIWDESKKDWDHQKITVLKRTNRPTYQDLFDLTKEFPEDINIISNTDIVFDETVKNFEQIKPRQCYALTRHEKVNGEVFAFEDVNLNCPPHYSQDVWAVRGSFEMEGCDKVLAVSNFTNRHELIKFTTGLPGCDNVIASKLSMKYQLKNPYRFIRCIHIHINKQRPRYSHRITGNHSRWGNLTKVPPSSL